MAYPYLPTADNQTFTRNKFTSDYWYVMGRNAQHLSDDRGRIVCNTSYIRYPLIIHDHWYAIEIPLTATPLEKCYFIRLSLAVSGDFLSDRLVGWRASSYNYGGGNPSGAGETMQTSLGPYRGDVSLVGQNGFRVYYAQYPRDVAQDEYWAPIIVETDWLKHIPNANLTAADRIIKIEINKETDDVTTFVDAQTWLMGVCIYGTADGVVP